jgi:hypothetical protein
MAQGRCTYDDADPSEAEKEDNGSVHAIHRAYPKIHQECR